MYYRIFLIIINLHADYVKISQSCLDNFLDNVINFEANCGFENSEEVVSRLSGVLEVLVVVVPTRQTLQVGFGFREEN